MITINGEEVVELSHPAQLEELRRAKPTDGYFGDAGCLMRFAGPFNSFQPEQEMLQNWKTHFTRKQVPFAVSKDSSSHFHIWKERRV